MADYKDEEYQFAEPETSVPHVTDSKQMGEDRDFQGRKKSRNIILFIALVMAFWAIYKFMGIFLSHAKQPPTSTVKPTLPVIAPPQTALPKLAPAKPLPVQPALSATQIQDLSNQKNRLNKLESEIVNLQTNLSEINTKLNELSGQINTLTTQINKPTPPPIVEVKRPIRPKKLRVVRSQIAYVPRPPYKLQAAIPGRAWLIRGDGTNLTVSLGDNVPGYGAVVGIDPNDGVVQMSSGATIKYRSH